MDASLIYYMGLNPETLTDQEWAARVKELEWIRKKEGKRLKV